MTLMPAPNLETARRVWFYMRERGARPLGGLFVARDDTCMREYLGDHGGIDSVDELLNVAGGQNCIVFVTAGLSLFRRFLESNRSHLWWTWFGSDVGDQGTDLVSDLCAEGVSDSQTKEQPTGAYRSNISAEWYFEQPWRVIDWFGVESKVVPYIKIMEKPTSSRAFERSFRDKTSTEEVKETFREYLADQKFVRMRMPPSA